MSKIREKLTKKSTPKDFVSNKNYRKYITGLKKGEPALDEAAIASESSKDGFFGIVTNVAQDKMSSSETISAYKHLWAIEDAFGEIKGSLKARPVYHWTDQRPLTVVEAMKELAEVRAISKGMPRSSLPQHQYHLNC